MTTSTAESAPGLLPGLRPPLLAAGLGVVLVAGALAGPALVWVGVLAAQVLLVLSWHRALGAADPVGGMIVGAVLVGAADVAVAVADEQVSFGPIAGVLGVGYLLAVGQQLVRRDGRTDLTASLAATVSLAAVGALGAGWAVLPRLPDGEAITVVAATAVAGAALGRLLPRSWGAFAGPLVLGIAASVLVSSRISRTGVAAWAGGSALPPRSRPVWPRLVQVRLPVAVAGWPTSAAWPVLMAAPSGLSRGALRRLAGRNESGPRSAADRCERWGVAVLLVVLAAAGAFGLWRARTDGRLRPPPSPTHSNPREKDAFISPGVPFSAFSAVLDAPSGPPRDIGAVLDCLLPALPGHAKDLGRGARHGGWRHRSSTLTPRTTSTSSAASMSAVLPRSSCSTPAASVVNKGGGTAAKGGRHCRDRGARVISRLIFVRWRLTIWTRHDSARGVAYAGRHVDPTHQEAQR